MGTSSDQESEWHRQRVEQTNARRKEVKRLIEQGLRPVTIAEILGASASVVSSDFRALGVDPSRNAVQEKRRAEVQKIWDEGIYSPQEIASRLGTSKSTVLNDLRALRLSVAHERRRSQPRSHTNPGTVVEDILSMLRASTVTLEQYDFEVVSGQEDWIPDRKTLKRWRRDIVAFNKQIRRVQTMITEIQKESMRDD